MYPADTVGAIVGRGHLLNMPLVPKPGKGKGVRTNTVRHAFCAGPTIDY